MSKGDTEGWQHEETPGKGLSGGAGGSDAASVPSSPSLSSRVDRPEAFPGCPHIMKTAAAHRGGGM